MKKPVALRDLVPPEALPTVERIVAEKDKELADLRKVVQKLEADNQLLRGAMRKLRKQMKTEI